MKEFSHKLINMVNNHELKLNEHEIRIVKLENKKKKKQVRCKVPKEPKATLDDVVQILIQFQASVEQRFNKLELRMDKLEARMDKLENRMDKLELRINNLENQVQLLNKAVFKR